MEQNFFPLWPSPPTLAWGQFPQPSGMQERSAKTCQKDLQDKHRGLGAEAETWFRKTAQGFGRRATLGWTWFGRELSGHRADPDKAPAFRELQSLVRRTHKQIVSMSPFVSFPTTLRGSHLPVPAPCLLQRRDGLRGVQ